MDYIEINKKAYDTLAFEYDTREHEIDESFWHNIYNDIKMNDIDLKLLEIGPGSGRNIKILKDYNSNIDITAVELSSNLCSVIKKNNPDIKLINDDILKVNLDDEFDIIEAIATIHLFPKEDALKLLKKIYNLLKKDGFLIIGTTINENDEEGFYIKEDYNTKINRFRHKYTKQSFEKLLIDSGFKIYKPYIIEEKSRNKIWYDIVVKK